ncbi:MAG TPA: hypothetical protein PK812_07145 [Beijerinckiaceae bacterium]|nr:hypothetical protein [Beijerinckiaceae bacterium]
MRLPCRIGRNGATVFKREGDGKSPRAILLARRGWWRTDRRLPPRGGVPLRPARKELGWCDAPGHACYNRLVRLPFEHSHETLCRDDRQYDVVLELDWNARPRIQGRGSAIFLHVMAEAGTGTAGCIALSPGHIDRLLACLGPRTRIRIV